MCAFIDKMTHVLLKRTKADCLTLRFVFIVQLNK